jgi:hypothetical protein
MHLRVPLALAFGVVMLVTASATAHSRGFVGARVGVPAHPITVGPRAVVASPGFVTVSAFHGVPHVAFVITPRRAIRPGPLVIVTRPSAMFFRQTVVVSPLVRGASPRRVTDPPRGIVPKVILVGPTGSTRQR